MPNYEPVALTDRLPYPFGPANRRDEQTGEEVLFPQDTLWEKVFHNSLVIRVNQRYFYPLVTKRFAQDDVIFLNWAYDEKPPMELPLSAADEPHRASIQLYHQATCPAVLTGKRVLEVSCGHGGGASYLVRTHRPASYTALDLNPAGIAFCRKRHKIPNLTFVQGDAQDLPFPDESFDAVINVEASHGYPDFPRFLREVYRVLSPGGDFLYTDLRLSADVPAWEAGLAGSPLREVSQRIINEQVRLGMERDSERRDIIAQRRTPTFLRSLARDGLGTIGSRGYRALASGEISYRTYHFVKD